MKPIILVGGGGHCRSVIEAVESYGGIINGIIDKPEASRNTVLGYPIIGNDNDIPKFINDNEFIITIGSIKSLRKRIRLHNIIKNYGGKFATVIASTAYVSPRAEIGAGTVVLHHATVNTNTKIGIGCIINTASNIEHDVILNNFVNISPGAMINGGCIIGEGTFIGSGAIVNNGVQITSDLVIGSGTVVCKDLHEKGVYCGVPSKRIK